MVKKMSQITLLFILLGICFLIWYSVYQKVSETPIVQSDHIETPEIKNTQVHTGKDEEKSNSNQMTLTDYITRIERIKESLISNADAFIQVEHDYMQRKVNQQQALEQFHMYFSAYKETTEELVSVKIPEGDPAYLTNQTLLTLTEEYYNGMVSKIELTEQGMNRSNPRTYLMRDSERLHTFENHLRDLKDFNEGR